MTEVFALDSRDSIKRAALSLAEHLKEGYRDYRGKDWTAHNFGLLREFCEQHFHLDPKADCFHSVREGHAEDKGEFLWDFLAVTKERGVLLVAESEQATHTTASRTGLKHDFEKLLYVFAPIRLLICKARTAEALEEMIKELTEYTHGCCQQFNPGSVFLLHFGMWGGEASGAHESHSYLWQSEGEPRELPPKAEKVKFTPV